MKKTVLCTMTAVLILTGLVFSSANAQSIQPASVSNNNVVVLTPGHSVTITYELGNVLWNDYNAYHTTYIVTMGAGTLTARIASATAVGQYANIVYASVGLMGLQPVFGYAYTGYTISLNAELGEIGLGILFTSIIQSSGNPDFPVVMGMIVSLS